MEHVNVQGRLPAENPSVEESENIGTKRLNFPGLDGLRAVAVLLVVVAHGSVRLWPREAVIRAGWVGVQIFFVLSGFLITYLLLAEKQRTGKISLRDFYIRRGLRIWPLYYAMLLLYAFVLPRFDSTAFSNVFVSVDTAEWPVYRDALWPHFVFLQNYLTSAAEVRLGLGVYWSLAVEEHFYLAWPMVVILFPRRALPWLLGLTIVGSSLLFTLTNLGIVTAVSRSSETTHNNLFAIAAGCLIGYVWVFHGSRITGFSSGLLRFAGWIAWLAIALVFVDGVSGLERNLIPGPGVVARLLVVAAAVALIVQVIARPDGGRETLLGHDYAVHIGRVSFGIYLTHPLVLGFFARSGRLWSSSLLGATAAMLVFAWLSIVVADVMYRRFEAPILKVKKRFQRF